MCDDGKETDILEKLFGKDTLTDESERDLTNRNELIDIIKGSLKSLPGKEKLLAFFNFDKPKYNLDFLMVLVSNVVFPFLFPPLKHSEGSLKAKCLTTRSASSKPHPGPSVPRLVGQASPPESPTTTLTASWSKSQESVKCDHVPSQLIPV